MLWKLIVTCCINYSCSLEHSELWNLNCRWFVLIGNSSTIFGENVLNYIRNDWWKFRCSMSVFRWVIIFLAKGLFISAAPFILTLLGAVTVDAELQGMDIEIEGLATGHVDEFILGLDWLQSKRADWNFKTRKLTVHGQVYQLMDGRKRAQCRRLVLQ